MRGLDARHILMVKGHVDANPAPQGRYAYPWAGPVSDGCIGDPGVSAMKVGDAACFRAVRTAVRTAADAGVCPRGDLIPGYVAAGLQGGCGSGAMMQPALPAEGFINARPGELDGVTVPTGGSDMTIRPVAKTRDLLRREAAADAIRINRLTIPMIRGPADAEGAAAPDAMSAAA